MEMRWLVWHERAGGWKIISRGNDHAWPWHYALIQWIHPPQPAITVTSFCDHFRSNYRCTFAAIARGLRSPALEDCCIVRFVGGSRIVGQRVGSGAREASSGNVNSASPIIYWLPRRRMIAADPANEPNIPRLSDFQLSANYPNIFRATLAGSLPFVITGTHQRLITGKMRACKSAVWRNPARRSMEREPRISSLRCAALKVPRPLNCWTGLGNVLIWQNIAGADVLREFRWNRIARQTFHRC